jgi:hypothetical protein
LEVSAQPVRGLHRGLDGSIEVLELQSVNVPLLERFIEAVAQLTQ